MPSAPHNVVELAPSDAADVIARARERARAWLDADPRRTHRDLGAGTGRSRQAIGRWLADDYAEGDSRGVAIDVLQFLDRHEHESRAAIVLKPVETPTHKAVTVALEMAAYAHRLAIIYGPPGCGKTEAALAFVARDPKGSILLNCRYGMGSPKGFLAEMLRVLKGWKDERYFVPARMSRLVIDLLRERPRFVIINDGHMAYFRVFEFLTALIEQAGVGVAVIGHECMHQTITAGRRIDSETYDRIADFASFTQVSHVGIPGVIDPVPLDDIRAVVKQILPEATADAIQFFADNKAFPSMRAVVNTAVDARGLLARRKTACDQKFIAQVLRLRRPPEVL